MDDPLALKVKLSLLLSVLPRKHKKAWKQAEERKVVPDTLERSLNRGNRKNEDGKQWRGPYALPREQVAVRFILRDGKRVLLDEKREI